MKLGQKIRTIARKASLKVSVTSNDTHVTIVLVKGDPKVFFEVCVNKLPAGVRTDTGNGMIIDLYSPWPTATKAEPKVKVAKVKVEKEVKPAKAIEAKVKKGDHSKAVDNLIGNFNPVIPKDLKKEGMTFFHNLTDHTKKTVNYTWDTPRSLRHQDEASNPEAKWFKALKASYDKFEAELFKFESALAKLGYKFTSQA